MVANAARVQVLATHAGASSPCTKEGLMAKKKDKKDKKDKKKDKKKKSKKGKKK